MKSPIRYYRFGLARFLVIPGALVHWTPKVFSIAFASRTIVLWEPKATNGIGTETDFNLQG